jgi:hypothetical protein
MVAGFFNLGYRLNLTKAGILMKRSNERTLCEASIKYSCFAPCFAMIASCALVAPLPVSPTSALIGTWDVSLRYDPNAAPSKTEMIITKVNNGSLVGTFYGTAMEVGRVTSVGTSWVIGARTADLSGAYWHSGRLTPDGSIEGQTLSEGRNFLMTWRAIKK